MAQTMDTGGMQRQLLELTRALPALGVDVQVILFYARGELFEELTGIGVPVHVIGKSSRYDLLRFSRRLRRCLTELGPDAIYAWQPVPSIFASLLTWRLRSVAVVWGVRQSAVNMAHYSAAIRWSFRLSKLLAARADAIIYNSEAGRRDHEAAGYPPATGVVIHNGIDVDRWRPLPETSSSWRTAWGVRVDDALVGVPARIDPMKGHVVLIAALARLGQGSRNIHCVFIGPGPQQAVEELLAQAHAASVPLRVEGHVDDMLGIYNALDLAVLPSLWGEGFPNVVAEAMACGVVTIASDVGDAALIVGEASRVVPPGDSVALASAIEDALNLPDAVAEARECRRRIEAQYSVQTMALATYRVLSDACTRRRVGAVSPAS